MNQNLISTTNAVFVCMLRKSNQKISRKRLLSVPQRFRLSQCVCDFECFGSFFTFFIAYHKNKFQDYILNSNLIIEKFQKVFSCSLSLSLTLICRGMFYYKIFSGCNNNICNVHKLGNDMLMFLINSTNADAVAHYTVTI